MEVRALLTALKEQEMDKSIEQLKAELAEAEAEVLFDVSPGPTLFTPLNWGF